MVRCACACVCIVQHIILLHKRNSCCRKWTQCIHDIDMCISEMHTYNKTPKKNAFLWELEPFLFFWVWKEDKKNEVKIIIVHCCDLHQYSCAKDVYDHTFCCSCIRHFVRRQRCVNHTYVSRQYTHTLKHTCTLKH